jgi:hypothetical protein
MTRQQFALCQTRAEAWLGYGKIYSAALSTSGVKNALLLRWMILKLLFLNLSRIYAPCFSWAAIDFV